MKVYATSDLHGNLEGIDPSGCDIAIIAGDLAPLNGFSKWHLQDQKKWIEKKFFELTAKHPDIEFIVVPGNHDKCLSPSNTISYPGISWNIAWPKNVHLLIDSCITVKGLKIYGMPWVPVISHCWAFEAEHDKLKDKCNLIPSNLDILVTHSPPHINDSCIDRSIQNGGYEAFGSNELSQAIFDKKPRYLFCGHIHSGTHGGVAFEDCMCYNVSRVDEAYDIAYKPTVKDITPVS